MNVDTKELDWGSSDVLIHLVKKIKEPLTSIIEANEKYSTLNATKSFNNNTSEVIFSSSQEITNLIEEIVKQVREKKAKEEVPVIYDLYRSNQRVKSMCEKNIDQNKISKQDALWLKQIENEIHGNISHKDLNLNELSYRMSVSERQLNRKIKNLLNLTPNKYIRILKLNKAKQFIDDYIYDTISQISYAVGYSDTHYFSKLFEQQYEISPKELLNKRRF